MTFKPDHDLHKRRFGRNVGLGVVLLVFVVLIYALTVAKVGELPGVQTNQEAGQ